LISAIDFDISSAALAAISTLSKASPDVHRRMAGGVVGDRRQRRRGRLHRRDAVADGLQHAFDAFAEPGDGFFHDGAACFLGAEQGIFLFHLAALGDVVVGADPVCAAGYGAVDHRNRAAVGQFGDEADDFSGRHDLHELGDVFVRIARQAAGSGAQPNDIGEPGRRQVVDFQVAIVADDGARLGVEHHDALGHVVERKLEQFSFAAQPAGRLRPPGTKNDGNAGQKTNQAHGGGQAPVELRRQTVQNPQHRVRLLIGCSVCSTASRHRFTFR